MKRILTTFFLFITFTFSSICVLAADIGESQSHISKNIEDPVIRSQIEDRRIKIGIEELRKKYPISLLDGKKKHYKAGQKINIDDYSEVEIKAAFLNADRNFISRKKVKPKYVTISDGSIFSVDEEVFVKDPLELILIDRACDKLRHSDWSKLNKKWDNLFDFIFSDNLPISYYTIEYVPREEAGFCLGSVEDERGV